MPLQISNSTVTLAWSTVHVVEFLNLPGGPTCATVAFCKCKETLVKVHGYYHLLTHTCAVQTTHIRMHACSPALSATVLQKLTKMTLVRWLVQLSVNWKKTSNKLCNLNGVIVQVRFTSSTKQQATNSCSTFFLAFDRLGWRAGFAIWAHCTACSARAEKNSSTTRCVSFLQ